jgi:ketosteroid isomerase-like protein
MTTRKHPLAFVAGGFAVALLLAACQAPQPSTLSSTDEATVRAIFDKALASARANDWATFVTLFADDVKYHPPGNPPLTSPEAIRKWAESGPPIAALDFEDVQVWGAGVYAYGTSTMRITRQGSAEDVGKQLAVFRRDGVGKWVVVAVSWNSNQSPAAAPLAATSSN